MENILTDRKDYGHQRSQNEDTAKTMKKGLDRMNERIEKLETKV
jgi:hypothetical protein